MLELGIRPSARGPAVIRPRSTALEERITVRATSQDNIADAARLTELFISAYGQSYFTKEVYNTDFWYLGGSEEDALRENLIGIVAEDNARFIGHLSLHHEPHSPIVQLMLPAVHPAFRKHVFQLSRIFWRYVERLAERQQWEMLFHFTHVSHPVSQLVATKCFRSIEMALLPNYLLPRTVESSAPRQAKTKSSLLASVNPLLTQSLPTRTLHLPERHAEVIKELYDGAQLDRIFGRGVSSAPLTRGPAAGPLPTLTTCPVTGVAKLLVAPSEVADINTLVRDESARAAASGRRLFVFIALDDPHCPAACQALERDGLRFCGVLPVIAGRDYLVLAHFSDNEIASITLYSGRAKALRDYMLGASLQDRQRLH